MLRTTKPKNARSKRVLEKREPKEYEAAKVAIFVRGSHPSARVSEAMTELASLKKPDVISFNKKNDVQPFEDVSSFEFWAAKNDAALFVLGNHQKKRPDNLTWIRIFDGQVLDMIETGVLAARPMRAFKGPKPGLGMRPIFHFNGPQFAPDAAETDENAAYLHLKSVLLDFYRGEELKTNQIALSGLQHVISVTAAPTSAPPTPPAADSADPTLAELYKAAGLTAQGTSLSAPGQTLTSPAGNLVQFRVYTVQMLASGSRIPRIELSECGPSFDFVMRRRRPAPADLMAAALKRPKTAAENNSQGKGKRKNIETDDMGDMVGRVHVGKQDLSGMQTRKMKGLKKGRDSDDDDDDDEQQIEMEDMTFGQSDDDDDEEEEEEQEEEQDEEEHQPAPAPSKKQRRSQHA